MKTTQIALMAACLLLGAVAGPVLAATIDDAVAEEPPTPPELRLLCRTFEVDLDFAATLETSDRTSEIGQWIGHEIDGGWRLRGVDFEVGQKHTGYPQGYVQVCLER